MAQCNRPDRDTDYTEEGSSGRWQFSNYRAIGCSKWDGKTDVDNYCKSFNGNRGGIKSSNSPLITDAQLKDLNYEVSTTDPYFWGRDPSGYVCDNGSIGNCRMYTPKENNKYACCTDAKNSTLVCGLNWCSADSNCTTYMNGYCSTGSLLIDDSNCYSKFSVSRASDISKLCSKQEHLRKPNCQNFCN